MAFRLELLPGQWERFQPVELQALWDAREWRRSRDMEVVGQAVFLIRAMLDSKPPLRKLLRTFHGYRPDENSHG